jgi:hypothetical protein
MNYEQLRTFIPSVTAPAGDCLIYSREAFGIPAKFPTATSGWDNAVYKHEGETPPSNISVPVWFSYSGPDGHVAVWVNGVIHSTSARGMQTFNSIQALIDWMNEGFVYLGWSEDIDGVSVVQEVKEPVSTSTVIVVNPGKYNVRTGPSLNASIINVAEGGQKYGSATILANGWAQITFTGKEGFIAPSGFKVVS